MCQTILSCSFNDSVVDLSILPSVIVTVTNLLLISKNNNIMNMKNVENDVLFSK